MRRAYGLSRPLSPVKTAVKSVAAALAASLAAVVAFAALVALAARVLFVAFAGRAAFLVCVAGGRFLGVRLAIGPPRRWAYGVRAVVVRGWGWPAVAHHGTPARRAKSAILVP